MKFKKYLRFISRYQLKDKSISVLVDSVYQKDQKDLFEIGSYSDLILLIEKLEEIRAFCIRHNLEGTREMEVGNE